MDQTMKLTIPAAKLMAICSQCGESEEVNKHAYKLTSVGRKFMCKKCRGSQQKVDYQTYIKSVDWSIFRKKALRHYGRKCYLCGREDGQIDLHHNTYKRLGRELLSDVVPLCHEHHKAYHEVIE